MGSLTKIGPCGGGGGDARDMNMGGVNRIVQVAIYHGHTVDSMSVLYERNGLEEWTPRWGGSGGGRSEVRLGTNEYLTRVEGHVGEFNGSTVLRSLKLVSNQRVFGPYGREEGGHFTLPAPAGAKILGFHARSGMYLDALGIYVKTD